jgi:helicase
MTNSLSQWIAAADTLRHLEHFQIREIPLEVGFLRTRSDDYYTSLVGELFDRMRENAPESLEWARLGNAFVQYADNDWRAMTSNGINSAEAALYAATSFYCGGYPASAYLSMLQIRPIPEAGLQRACYDLLVRPAEPTSNEVSSLLTYLRSNDLAALAAANEQSRVNALLALPQGPDAWVLARLYQQLLARFSAVNLRAVLPDRGIGFWNLFVESLISRRPSTWEFFPSQIEAIRGNLLNDGPSFTLQMPTGAGKTTLCETLLFDHLQRHPNEAAIFLVPFRSLASELRRGLVQNLNAMGISARCAYGGTVPSGDEVRSLQDTRLIVATPEALSGLLTADQAFLQRVSLVICDEGHLLGTPVRGIGLELLLARLKSREVGPPRFVFISAIVPNVQEINAWLGGTEETIIRSDYRPASAEYAVLRNRETTAGDAIDLEVHPHLEDPPKFTVNGFLARSDFQYRNDVTNRINTLNFKTFKRRAVAAARKSLTMGSAVIFAANKRGDQGAIGLAEELVEQLKYSLTLPQPLVFANREEVQKAVEYLTREYGADWIGVTALAAGAVLHHGDIPQEAREVLERLLVTKAIRFAVCTSTLAEGVNLPIRTLVLYSIRRRLSGGAIDTLLARDIKNLVGRAGRAGSSIKGLVICVNDEQWPAVERVALNEPGENMIGALKSLVDSLQRYLAIQNHILTNDDLDETPSLHELIDGIDSTLIDLAAEEITEEQLIQVAVGLADRTFASQQSNEPSQELMRTVFRLRAMRVAGVRAAGRIGWVRETGAKLRMIEAVETGLLPSFEGWETLVDPVSGPFVDAVLAWAWSYGDVKSDVRDAYRLAEHDDVETVRVPFFDLIRGWLRGNTYAQLATSARLDVDDVLGIYAKAISYSLQTVVEQAIALSLKFLESNGRVPGIAVTHFPSCLRFGVPTEFACALSNVGLRHRRAALLLSTNFQIAAMAGSPRQILLTAVRDLLVGDEPEWRRLLGDLVFQNTLTDAG